MVSGTSKPASEPVLLNVQAVAQLLGCSARHVWRLHDAGQLPQAVRLGHLVRWPRSAIMGWIGQGCPSSRKGVAK